MDMDKNKISNGGYILSHNIDARQHLARVLAQKHRLGIRDSVFNKQKTGWSKP